MGVFIWMFQIPIGPPIRNLTIRGGTEVRFLVIPRALWTAPCSFFMSGKFCFNGGILLGFFPSMLPKLCRKYEARRTGSK